MTTTHTVDPAPSVLLDTTTVWVLEDAVSRQHRHLALGDDLHAAVTTPDRRLVRDLLGHLPVHVDWTLDLDPVEGQHPAIRGRVGQIVAVTCPYRRDPASDGWQPMRWAARTRIVESTCSPDPARSVWPPSGSPVLIGFLLTLIDDDRDHHPC